MTRRSNFSIFGKQNALGMVYDETNTRKDAKTVRCKENDTRPQKHLN